MTLRRTKKEGFLHEPVEARVMLTSQYISNQKTKGDSSSDHFEIFSNMSDKEKREKRCES